MLDLKNAQEWVVTTKLGSSDSRPGTQQPLARTCRFYAGEMLMSTFVLTAAFYGVFSVNKWSFSIFLTLQGIHLEFLSICFRFWLAFIFVSFYSTSHVVIVSCSWKSITKQAAAPSPLTTNDNECSLMTWYTSPSHTLRLIMLHMLLSRMIIESLPNDPILSQQMKSALNSKAVSALSAIWNQSRGLRIGNCRSVRD